MASTCTSNSGKDTRFPFRRPTYVNRHGWLESEAEFMKTVSSNEDYRVTGSPTRVVDSRWCREMYLRSYTFSRKEEGVKDKTLKCLGRFKQRVVSCARNNGSYFKGKNIRVRVRVDFFMPKNASCVAFFSVFHRFLSRSSKVDEANHHGEDF